MNILTFDELIDECKKNKKNIYELIQEIEATDADTSIDSIRENVKLHIETMKSTIATGMKSSEKAISQWCGDDCIKLQKRYSSNKALLGKLFEKIITYSLATIEENLRMGKIVACPTAGSCGIVPSVIIAVAEEQSFDEDTQINALITAGAIGAIISNKVQLAGAVAGCQAECGVAAAMCAGALTQMLGGDISQILNAVALTMKNLLGLTCDPVCGLVEVPCVKRNPILAIHAVTSSELALAGIESKIPLDEVIDAVRQTGQLMSPMLKESSLAGLATTKTALKLKEKIFG